MMRLDMWPDFEGPRKPFFSRRGAIVLVAIVLAILAILIFALLGNAAVWDDGWEPDINIVIQVERDDSGAPTITPFLVSNRFRWELDQDRPAQAQIDRVVQEERLIYYALGSQPSSNPVPEPVSMLLMGTGLIGLWVLGRKRR